MADEDMYLFNDGIERGFSGQDFDTFLTSQPDENDRPPDFLDPNDLIKREHDANSPAAAGINFAQSHRGSESGSSSSESMQYHNRTNSEVSAASSALAAAQGNWVSGINGMSMPSSEQFFDDSAMSGIDQDFEASNKQMASDFDFETAASTPSGFDAATIATKPSSIQPFVRNTNFAHFTHASNRSPKMPTTAQPAFFFAASREASPLNAMLPGAQGHSPWSKHSPSPGLEETFNHITMNGDSPGNATFSPSNLQFPGQGFSFEADSSATPSTFAKDVSSPPSTVNSADGLPHPHLTVHPTSLKSRVETQIPIKLTLSFLPSGVKKLRLPTHTVSKPKFLAKGEVDRSPEILELHTSLVCTSAMQDPARLQRALARARGEELATYTRPSPSSSTTSSSKDDEERPLNGGEVKICSGCIQRERKRASRKKQKKPEEEEMFQKDEEKRVVVFNTNEIKEWADGSQETDPASVSGTSVPTGPLGAMHVELPMRIACYCRHQNEKLGFQVIITIKDFRDRVVAQAMTNPIMITDDHKTHNAAAPVQYAPPPLPSAPQFPGAGVFTTAGGEAVSGSQGMPKLFKQSFSTTDLAGLQHNFNPSFPMASSSNPFAIPSSMSTETSATLTPRNLSRPASPSGLTGPTPKKRKQSGSGKLPSGLTMTRLDTSHAPSGSATMPNTAGSPPFAQNMTSYMQPQDRNFPIAPSWPAHVGPSPPTPNGNDPYTANISRSFSLENLPRQTMISAPPSQQPSRPGSPGSARNSFSAGDPNFGQAVSSQLLNQTSRRPPPLIHKLVPAEGSVTGGTEVTLLGNGFYQGLEVMFGDTEATTTTFWGEKCLNCIAPPALQPGTVTVVFKHEHLQYSAMQHQSQTRSTYFTYVDDRELEMFRLALRTIGKQMQNPTDDPYSAAQQLIQGQSQSMWPSQGNFSVMGGHQRNAGLGEGPMDIIELENSLVQLLEFMDQKAPAALQRLDLRRPSGLTLLHLASSLGLTRFVAGMLARGANPNLQDKNGHTAMHHAAMNGHTHIIHRLRLAGASHKARSIRNFTPADLATSLLTYQAVLMPSSHYRSRSVGGTPMRLQSRQGSSSSLRSFWENASMNYVDSDCGDSPQGVADELDVADQPKLRANSSAIIISPSRRGSAHQNSIPAAALPNAADLDSGPHGAPSAFMLAWRDHLVAQVQQFNENAQSVMPSLAIFNGPLQVLQDYQAYPMVRRVSSLFPQMPSSRQNTGGHKDGWWETLTGSSSPSSSAPPPETSAPPAYGDLYPDEEGTQPDWSLKKSSAMRAAVDAMADSHFEAQSSAQATTDWEKTTESASAGALASRRPRQRVKLSQDRKLFFFWIPVLLVLLVLTVRNSGVIDLISRRPRDVQTQVVEAL